MKFWTLLALAASAAAFPLEGPVVQLHKRDGVRKHIGYRVATKVRLPILFHLMIYTILYSIPYSLSTSQPNQTTS